MEAKVEKARRLGRVVLVLGVVVAASVASAACAEEETSTSSGPKPTIGPIANDPTAAIPVDATPSPDGKDIYFIANPKTADEDNIGFERQAAVYKVSASGGAITKLHQGAHELREKERVALGMPVEKREKLAADLLLVEGR